MPGNLLGGFEVVVEDGLLKIGLAYVFAGVDVDHRERLGMFDDQRAPRWQPHLSIERLVELLMDPVLLEERQSLVLHVVKLDAISKFGIERGDVLLHLCVQRGVVYHDPAVFVAELLANHSHRQWRLTVEQRRALRLFGRLANVFPLLKQPSEISGQLMLGGVFGSRTHNDPVLFGFDAIEHRAQPATFSVGQSLRDAIRA